ncbi:MAG: ABC transporter ATP-binding protein [Anaerolineae bacterium UTCFX2]|jgi:ATP-binding cassette subfamily B protein|nr:MAG: ABC transporter ATP-binding protein [Anaerolineae bacterium UTCFX2]
MTSLKRALGYLRPYWLLTIGIFLTLLLAAGLNLVIPALTQRIIDNGIDGRAPSFIIWGALAIVGVAIFRAIFTFLQEYWSAKASQNVAYDMRNALYHKIQKLSFGYHDRAQTGQLLTRATSDVDRIQMFVGRGFIMFITALIMLFGSLALLVSLDWQLSLIVLVLIPATMLVFFFFTTRAFPLFSKVQQFIANLNTILQENLAGVRVVQAFAREPYEMKRFSTANRILTDQTIEVGKLIAAAFPLVFLISNLGTLAVVWMGGFQVIDGRLTIGELVAFQSYLMLATFPVLMLGMIIAMISQAGASAERVFEILDVQSEVVEKPEALSLPVVQGRVRFDEVWFSYYKQSLKDVAIEKNGRKRGRKSSMGGLGGMGMGMGLGMGGSEAPAAPPVEEWVLKNVSFTAEPGEVIALLGATGSGKSTVINLIPRFYDVTRGKVTIDGIDVRDVALDSLRSQIGMVMQETTLFTGTVQENIAYGRPGASLDTVIAAAKAAEAHDFIMEFTEGYDTHVGERGVTLSGGQKQRIAIARALLLDPRILILDDSTSNVDLDTEARIQRALKYLMHGRTSFVIAQRISTVRNADKIIVLDNGAVVAQGKHADLMRDSAIYAEIFSSQLSGDCELFPDLCEEENPEIDQAAGSEKEVL